jgi:protein tyrosine/serine phosphatase
VSIEHLAELDGPANFRDLGGYRTTAGGVTRRGRLFRSDSLSYLSERDVAALRDELGVRTVIDLRAGHEVEQFGHGPLATHVRQLHLPIVDRTREPATTATTEAPVRQGPRLDTLDQIYAFMLREYADRFAVVLRVIADGESHPLVFHCAAGKDRTGLVAALVLSLCGVPDESIVDDFAFTESRMPEIIARHTAWAERSAAEAEVAGQQYGAQAATMHAVLQSLRDEHGSVEDYVLAAGLTTDEIATLRAALVEPAG